MTEKLKKLATISSGATFRSRIEASQAGNVRLIQMKDLGADNLVHLASCVRIEHPNPKPSQLAERGDIIFRSRGQSHTAALLNQAAASAIVAAPLFRIRADQAQIQPEFLLWWLNQASAQAYFASRARGTMVQMISKQVLEELAVPLPALKQQARIANLFRLATREQQILENIKQSRALYTQAVLMQMTQEHANAN